MAFEANEQTLVLVLGCSGFCVVVCAGICCCRDIARRSRLRELSHSDTTKEASGDPGHFNRILLTGYQAPIRRLDPFASRKTQGNNVQPNYAKVTSAVEDNIDHLMRAYGSLAAEIDPEDRLKLLSSRPSWGGRRSSGTEPNLWKAARSLENESGEAPSRSSIQRPGPGHAGHQGDVANEVRTSPPEREPPETTPIPPQVLGKQVEETSGALTPIQHKSGPSQWGAKPLADTLMRHIELPTLEAVLPVENVVESSGTSSDSDDVRQRDAKFDALDAELAEQLNDSSGFTLDPSSLHTSMGGLPKRKALKRQKSGKDRKKTGKESQGQKAPGHFHGDVSRV